MNIQKGITVLSIKYTMILIFFLLSNLLFAQDKTQFHEEDEKLFQGFIESYGKATIVFDSSNIKQFWVDNTVVSKDGFIDVHTNKSSLGEAKSIPLRLKLINVNIDQDCMIDMITDQADCSFEVLNSMSQTLTRSSFKSSFLDYSVLSTTFHMEQTPDFEFNIVFSSKRMSPIRIKRIILSFSKNKEIIGSPKAVDLTSLVFINNFKDKTTINNDNQPITITGEKSQLLSTQKIPVGNNVFLSKVTIENIGTTSTRIFIGYAPYTEDDILINNMNNPFNEKNNLFKIISSEENSNKIIVDAYPEWKKGCNLVINAKEDLSDFPNFSFIGEIQDITKLPNNQSEITLNKNVTKSIPNGMLARIQAPASAIYLYTYEALLQPGEKGTFYSIIQKDNNYCLFSTKAFCRGVSYVTPIILSFSSGSENTIRIKDFEVYYYEKK